MWWIILIGLPLAMLSAGLFALSSGLESPAPQPQPEAEAEQKPAPLILFQPTVWTTDMRQVPVDELVAGIEEQLRKRRNAVRQASKDGRKDAELA